MYHLGLESGGILAEYAGTTSFENKMAAPGVFPAGVWRHVCSLVSTGDEGKKEMWVDGAKVATVANVGVPPHLSRSGTFYMAVGDKLASPHSIHNQFVGHIDDVFYYDKFLSAQEIAAVYARRSPSP